jgi:type IV fimbrial biogenesis protein FimT
MTSRRTLGRSCLLPVPAKARQRGMTLVELMFTIFIMAVLAMLAVPSFRDASLGSRLTATANSLHGAIQIARSEAIKANVPIVLCASSDGEECATGGDWDQGWIVVRTLMGLDVDGNPVVLDEDILHSEPAQQNSFKVIESGGKLTLTFQPIGIGATDAVFTVCREDPVGNQERVVSVTATGSAYVTTTENGECPPT